jgi:hydroxymethylglutaryl-CoA reductase (NADPH)
MANDQHTLKKLAKEICEGRDLDQMATSLSPDKETPLPKFPRGSSASQDDIQARWEALNCNEAENLLKDFDSSCYEANIENYVGTVKVPMGIAGPIRVNGLFAQGDYPLPLATTEAALIASYHRGASLINLAGGCSAMLLAEGVTRSPGFAFQNLKESGQFLLWALEQTDQFCEVANSTTNHGKMLSLRVIAEGSHVYLLFDFMTGDASGQNMVTIATQAVCDYILEHAPIKPQYHFVEANASGDKKASAQSFGNVRGKKVTAEVLLEENLIKKILHTDAHSMEKYWKMSALGGVMTGTIGVQAHYANGLAALFLSTGQDIACTSEASVGITRFETRGNDLYAAVTLPNLIVGTVGGGTGLPTQKAALQLMGLYGAGHARAFAEVCAACCLAGELSIIGALTAGHFTSAHDRLARKRKQ